MHENHLFEYAVLRVVPQVEREEFINVGVILYCGPKKFLECLIEVDEVRLNAFCSHLDIPELRKYLHSFERLCKGGTTEGPIGQLSMPERFRWLTSTRSTIVQSSKVHPGLCSDPREVLHRLFTQLVLCETKK